MFKDRYNANIRQLQDTKNHCVQLLKSDLPAENREQISQLKTVNDIKLEAAVKAFIF